MKKLLFPALAAAVALSACAPKSPKGHDDQAKRPTVKTETVETKNVETKSEVTKPVEAKSAETTVVENKTVDTKADAKQEAPAAASAPAEKQAKTDGVAIRADGKPEIFYGDFTCTKEFPARFAPFQKAFADAAKATDEAMKAMRPVVDRMDDSSAYHTKVKDSYLQLTEAYKALLKEFGMPFGCFYMLPKGGQVRITSETFKAEYDQLRKQVGDLIGKQHLGPEITDI